MSNKSIACEPLQLVTQHFCFAAEPHKLENARPLVYFCVLRKVSNNSRCENVMS